MRCLHPIRLFDTGCLTDGGKVAYIYDSTGATSISPMQAEKCGYHVDHFLTEYREVPCGVCVACRRNRARSWQFRCLAELSTTQQNKLSSYFLTLTYDDAHNPGVLLKKDVQDFNKRLRKAKGPFRFYASVS